MKKNALALVALLALGLWVWFVFEDESGIEESGVPSLPFPVDVSKIDELEILRHEGSGSTLREEHIRIKKVDKSWQITSPVAYRAHQELIEMMIESIKGIRVIDAISDNVQKHKTLEVDEELGIIVKAFAAGMEVLHFIVGVTQKDITFIRMPDSNTVYRTTGSFRNRFNKSTNKLRHKLVFDLDEQSVSRMKYANQFGTWEMKKKGEGNEVTFEPIGTKIENFDAERAGGSALALTKLVARDFEDTNVSDDVTGLGEGASWVEFDAMVGGDAKTLKMWIGAERKKMRQTYVKTSESKQIFLVPSQMVSRFQVGADDFARSNAELKKQLEAQQKAADHANTHHRHLHTHGHNH